MATISLHVIGNDLGDFGFVNAHYVSTLVDLQHKMVDDY
jgi:hypothetical protein